MAKGNKTNHNSYRKTPARIAAGKRAAAKSHIVSYRTRRK